MLTLPAVPLLEVCVSMMAKKVSLGKNGDSALDVTSRFVDMMLTLPALPGPVVLAVIAGSPRESETDRSPVTNFNSMPNKISTDVQRVTNSRTWGVSENNRQARFYRITPAGRRALGNQVESWKRFAAALDTVLRTT